VRIRGVRRFEVLLAVLVWGLAAALPAAPATARSDTPSWVAAWGLPVNNSSTSQFQDQTIRVVARAGFGGSRVRVRLSNANGTQALTLQDAHIGIAGSGASVQGRNVPLTVKGSPNVTIPVGQSVMSDPADLTVTALQSLAVSVYAPGSTGQGTGNIELSTYYTATGDHASDADGGAYGGVSSTGGFFVTGVDVYAPNDGLIVGFGDSITEGFMANSQGWPYWLADRLAQLAAKGGPRFSIIDMGISGNRVTQDTASAGVSAEHRLQPDVLDQTGLKAVLMMEGINDIGAGVPKATLEDGLSHIVARVHGAGAKILLSPLTPAGDTTGPTFYSPFYSSPDGVQERHDVNDWIHRTSGVHSSAFDFDPVIRDPQSNDHLLQDYNSGDNLHPNLAGQQAMAKSVDLATIEQLIKPAESAPSNAPTGAATQPPRACTSRRTVTVHIRGSHGATLRALRVSINGRRVKVAGHRRASVRIDLKGRPRARVVVRITAITNRGRTLHDTRRYQTCQPS
jgi:lysophospholipase L1-like esterase